MPYISARAIYLTITFIIVVVFGITGAYYYLDLQKNIKITERVETPTQYNQEIEAAIQTTPIPTVSSQLLLCNQTCQFSFQCEGDLECVDIDGAKKCLSSTCPEDTNCSCDNNQQATAAAQLAQQYNSEPEGIGGMEITVTPTAKPSPTTTPKPSAKPTATAIAKIAENYYAGSETEEYNPQLPDAGFPNISILVIVLAILSTSTGLILLHKKS